MVPGFSRGLTNILPFQVEGYERNPQVTLLEALPRDDGSGVSTNGLAEAQRVAIGVSDIELTDAPGLIHGPTMYGRIFAPCGIQTALHIFPEETIHILHAKIDRASKCAVARML